MPRYFEISKYLHGVYVPTHTLQLQFVNTHPCMLRGTHESLSKKCAFSFARSEISTISRRSMRFITTSACALLRRRRPGRPGRRRRRRRRGALSRARRRRRRAAHRVVDDRAHTHTPTPSSSSSSFHLAFRGSRPTRRHRRNPHQTFDSLKPPRAVRCTRAGLI